MIHATALRRVVLMPTPSASGGPVDDGARRQPEVRLLDEDTRATMHTAAPTHGGELVARAC